jgi:hypothetical protein
MQIQKPKKAIPPRVVLYKIRHFGTLEGWLRELNLDHAPVEVKEVKPIACYNAVKVDVVCHGVTLARFMKMNSGYSKYPYILTHLNKAVPQFERDWETGKLRKVGTCTSQILDFYWGGGVEKILADEPTVKDLAPLRKRLLKGVDRFRRSISLSIVACQLREKETQLTPKVWDLIKAAHHNPKYALRMISSLKGN